MTPKLGVSYLGNRFVSHAQEDLKRIAGCSDYVVHTVSETDLSYHKAVTTKIFSESRRLGLEVWADPWGLGGVFGGETFSKFLVDHRNSWQIMSDNRITPSACLNRPEFRSFVMEWVLTVRDMGAQVIFWDEPHISFDLESEWGGIYSCICDVCQQKFKRQHGSQLPKRLNDFARQFRRDNLKGFLNEMMGFAKSKGLKNALCLYAFKGFEEYEQIWNGAAALADLDIFGCDPYWRWRGRHDPFGHVQEFSKKVVNSATLNNKGSQIWLQGMRLPAGAEDELRQGFAGALSENVTHIATWSYDGGEILDTVLSERPAEVWKTVERIYKEVHRK